MRWVHAPMPSGGIALLVLLALNVLAYGMIWHDKRQAQRQGWRVREGSLLLPVALGGGIGGYLAMRRFRHKTRKASFRLGFWCAAAFSLVAWGLLVASGIA